EKALEIRRQLAREPILIGNSYINIGIIYTKDDPAKSLEYFNEALKIYKASLDANHPKIAYAYSNLAFANADLGYYTDALSYLDLVEGIWDETYKGDHPNKAYTLSNRGRVLEKKGDWDAALIYQQEALKMYLGIHGPKHPDIANT